MITFNSARCLVDLYFTELVALNSLNLMALYGEVIYIYMYITLLKAQQTCL